MCPDGNPGAPYLISPFLDNKSVLEAPLGLLVISYNQTGYVVFFNIFTVIFAKNIAIASNKSK